jgi:hypothetical protein
VQLTSFCFCCLIVHLPDQDQGFHHIRAEPRPTEPGNSEIPHHVRVLCHYLDNYSCWRPAVCVPLRFLASSLLPGSDYHVGAGSGCTLSPRSQSVLGGCCLEGRASQTATLLPGAARCWRTGSSDSIGCYTRLLQGRCTYTTLLPHAWSLAGGLASMYWKAHSVLTRAAACLRISRFQQSLYGFPLCSQTRTPPSSTPIDTLAPPRDPLFTRPPFMTLFNTPFA